MATVGRKEKAGRNLVFCKYYASTCRREKNKLMRLQKHLRRYPNDANAIAAVEALRKTVHGGLVPKTT